MRKAGIVALSILLVLLALNTLLRFNLCFTGPNNTYSLMLGGSARQSGWATLKGWHDGTITGVLWTQPYIVGHKPKKAPWPLNEVAHFVTPTNSP